MKNVTEQFKMDLKTFGRQFDVLMWLNGRKIDSDYLNAIHISFNTDLFKTVMYVIEIDSKIYMSKGTKIRFKVGIKTNESQYEYIEYNNFRVETCERQEDTLSWRILAYDKMKNSMIDYDLVIGTGLTVEEINQMTVEEINALEVKNVSGNGYINYPISVRNYLIKICQRLGYDTSDIPLQFVNSTKIIHQDLHSEINYTFRDILDELATITGSFIYFKGNKIQLGYVSETEEIIDESNLSEDNVTIGEEYMINSLVFARAEDSDMIYRKDDESISENGLHEFKISDNQLLSTNDRDEYIDELFNYLKTFKYYPYDVKSIGIMYLEICDRFTFNLNGKTYSTIMLNDEINIEDGISETLYAEEPNETESEYKYADTTDKRINQTYILVDKQNKKIEQVVSETQVLEQGVNANSSAINNNYQEITNKLNDYAKNDDVVSVRNAVETLQDSTQYYIGVTEDIQVNGVSKVTTTTGFTFDEEGLKIDKTNADTGTVIDNAGFKVIDKTSASNEELLYAGVESGESIVRAKNMTVSKYMTIGKNSRIEDYETTGTGIFWIGG